MPGNIFEKKMHITLKKKRVFGRTTDYFLKNHFRKIDLVPKPHIHSQVTLSGGLVKWVISTQARISEQQCKTL
jgi:hypothetical protein